VFIRWLSPVDSHENGKVQGESQDDQDRVRTLAALTVDVLNIFSGSNQGCEEEAVFGSH
jgi:hypothetical protein